jgi:hypothetical protein
VNLLPRLLMVGTLLFAAVVATAAPSACAEACLRAQLERFEKRVLAHDHRGLRFTAGYRGTENYRAQQPGEGYWQSVASIFHQKVFADAETGQVAAVGMLDHGGRDAYFALRLKIEGQSIAQSEMTLVHKGDASFFEERREVPVADVYAEKLPVGQRVSRHRLLRAAEQFVDAWQYRNEDLAPLADLGPDPQPCHFFENNVELTDPNGPSGATCGGIVEYGGKNGVRGTGKAGNGGAPRPPGQDAKAGGDPGTPPPGVAPPPTVSRPADPTIGRPLLMGSQMWMRDRRYPIVDVERGVVFAYHIQGGEPARPGEALNFDRPPRSNGPPAQGAPQGAAYMVALFKIVGGRIVRVDHFELEGGPNVSGGFAD